MKKNQRNLLQVFTGNGKGKTTAAIGQAIRALGHNQRVCFIQCIKSGSYGEHVLFEELAPRISFYQFGAGFTHIGNREAHAEQAKKAFTFIFDVLSKGEYDLVILDEFTYALKYNYLNLIDVIDILSVGKSKQNIIVTGRDACDELCEIADMVSIISPEKHHYQSGIHAQEGVEF